MTLPRLLVLVIGISLILALVIWLVQSIYNLYFQISFPAPILANLLLLLIIGLLGVLIGYFVYYFNLATNKKKGKSTRFNRLGLPQQKTEAAGVTLNAVRQQVQQIQDEVVQKVLLRRSKEIEASLAKGEYQLVVFGTGSAGKTSLVNALSGEIVGQVEPTMGTTKIGQSYRLKFKGISRDILVTDTPGILEAGIAGTERERLARELATEADLLLFVVDNDLRQSEYDPLQMLVEIGKRSLLVFNKTDIYTQEDQQIILQKLQHRISQFMSPSDVISIAANPQPYQLPTGEIIQGEPEIIPLVKRIIAVLRAEGEDLIADNILLQSQRLGDQARAIIDQQRRRQSERIIERYQWISAGVVAVTPLPMVDLLAAAAVNTQMVIEIGQVHGCQLNSERGKELAISLGKTLVSLGIVKGTIEVVSTALQLTLATYLVGKAIQGVTAAYLTRIAGKSFIEYFRSDQDWGDGGMSEVVQRQFQLSRKDEFIKGFISDALSKVVVPLKSTLMPPENLEDQEEMMETEELEQRSSSSDYWEW